MISRMSARDVFAAELSRLRKISGWTLTDLGKRAAYDQSYLFRLEKGEKLGSIEVARALDKVYGTEPHLEQLWLLARDDVVPNRYHRFLTLAAEADVVQEFSVSTIPGLLQTEEYARALLNTARPQTPELLAEQVAVRMSRQQRLRDENPPHLRALLDEGILRRAPKDLEVWQGQLQRLLDDAELPQVTVQVLPLSAGLHDLLGGSLTLLWLPDGRSVAYVESIKTAELFEEPEEVAPFKLSYDLVRDLALTPGRSLAFIRQLMEDGTSCPPPVQT